MHAFRHPYIFALIVVLSAGLLPAQTKTGESDNPASDRAQVQVEAGKVFVYKKTETSEQKMEIYFPPEWSRGRRLPAVILFHGGGWGGGKLDQFRYASRYFASRGLVAATASYELAAKGNSPSRKRVCVTDAKSAIRWLKSHATELGIDPNCVITGGGSAGGHIALLATLNPGLNDPADPANVDTHVVAYLLFNPAFDAKDAGDSEVDVMNFLKPKLPPSIVFSGTKDRWKQGTDTVRARLKELGDSRDELWLAAGQEHGFFNSPPWQDVTLAEADRFLARLGYLTGPATLPPPPKGEMLKRAP